jgi:hypothetical protein
MSGKIDSVERLESNLAVAIGCAKREADRLQRLQAWLTNAADYKGEWMDAKDVKMADGHDGCLYVVRLRWPDGSRDTPCLWRWTINGWMAEFGPAQKESTCSVIEILVFEPLPYDGSVQVADEESVLMTERN